MPAVKIRYVTHSAEAPTGDRGFYYIISTNFTLISDHVAFRMWILSVAYA